MFARHTLTASLLGALACGGGQPIAGQIPKGSPSRAYDANQDGTAEGQQYDTDGDGRYDAVDLDGDGLLEGGDFDGDGVVTLFSTLGTGLQMPSAEELSQLSQESSPDVFATLGGAAAPADVNAGASVDLSSKIFSPQSQGESNSCAAFALAAVATYARVAREGGDPNAQMASPAFIYDRLIAGTPNAKCGDPTAMAAGFAALVLEGAAPLSEVAYNDKVCAQNPSAASAAPYRVGGFTVLQPFDRARVKELLSAGYPIPFGSTLPPNFQRWSGAAAAGVFKSETGQMAGVHGGGHAMVIVGYDDSRSAYRILNSWSTDWGQGGYAWWDFADLEAREGLMAMAPIFDDGAPGALMPATPDSLEVQVIGAAAWSSGAAHKLTVRLRTSGPIALEGAAVPQLGASVMLTQVMAFGDVTFDLQSAAAAGEYDLELSGGVLASSTIQALTSAPKFTRTVKVMVAAEVPSSN